MIRFAPRACESCATAYAPRSRTQRYCKGCEYAEPMCERCGKTFVVRRADLDKRPARFCSQSCRRLPSGIYLNTFTNRWVVMCRDGTTMLYARAVMAGRVGRLLERSELVHHVNADTQDDRPENLELLSAREHVNLHRPDMRAGWARRKAAGL